MRDFPAISRERALSPQQPLPFQPTPTEELKKKTPSVVKDPFTKKLSWSLMEAKIKLLYEKTNLIHEQVLIQKLKKRRMELEIEKIEEEKARLQNFHMINKEIVDLDPSLRKETPSKKPKRQVNF